METNQISSDEKMPYVASSTFQRNQGPNYEEVENVWLSNNPSRSNLMPLPEASESQVRSKSLNPYSESSLLPSTHTIILDFSMVQFVDSQASVVLRQVNIEESLIKVLIPTSHHCPNPNPVSVSS